MQNPVYLIESKRGLEIKWPEFESTMVCLAVWLWAIHTNLLSLSILLCFLFVCFQMVVKTPSCLAFTRRHWICTADVMLHSVCGSFLWGTPVRTARRGVLEVVMGKRRRRKRAKAGWWEDWDWNGPMILFTEVLHIPDPTYWHYLTAKYGGFSVFS